MFAQFVVIRESVFTRSFYIPMVNSARFYFMVY